MALGTEREEGGVILLNRQLDPTQTGLEAEKLDWDLRNRIIGGLVGDLRAVIKIDCVEFQHSP